VTAFGKLIRTTAFRLTLVYLFIFALFAASLLVYFAWNTRRLITEQITTTVNAETGEIAASCEITGVHLDRRTRKSAPFGDQVRRQIQNHVAVPPIGGGVRADAAL